MTKCLDNFRTLFYESVECLTLHETSKSILLECRHWTPSDVSHYDSNLLVPLQMVGPDRTRTTSKNSLQSNTTTCFLFKSLIWFPSSRSTSLFEVSLQLSSPTIYKSSIHRSSSFRVSPPRSVIIWYDSSDSNGFSPKCPTSRRPT